MDTIIGFSALGIGMIYRIPQIYKMWNTGKAEDISLWMFFIQSLSYVLYTIYGYLIGDLVYIISSIVSLLQNLLIAVMYCRFTRKVVSSEPKPQDDLEKLSAVARVYGTIRNEPV